MSMIDNLRSLTMLDYLDNIPITEWKMVFNSILAE